MIEAKDDVGIYVPDLDDAALISPLVKIPGGKRDLAEEICGYMPTEISSYIEPFAGGAAVYWYLVKTGRLSKAKDIVLSDLDRNLIEMYESVKVGPKDLHARLEQMHNEYVKSPEEVYYKVRELWNERHESPAKCIFLRSASFNGLWRENKQGKMNAPWSKRPKLSLPSLEKLEVCSKALQNVDLSHGDFRDTLSVNDYLKKSGTTLYCDSPYLGGWVGYQRAGWLVKDMEDLISLCADWSGHGASVVLSHSDTEVVREMLTRLWPSAKVHTTARSGRINSKGDERDPVKEIIVVG